MNDPQHIDPERLAALLDGRLGDAEAAVVRAQLAAADGEVQAAYADAVAVSRDAADSAVVPIAAARSRRWVTPAVAAIAAVLLAVVVLRVPRGGGVTAVDGDLTEYGTKLPPGVALPATAIWGATRGSSEVVTESGRAVRLGALMTDLEVALQNHDSASAVIAESMSTTLRDVPGLGVIANGLRDSARVRGNARDAFLRRVAREGAGAVDQSLARAGAWLEAARLASGATDAAFFERYPADVALRAMRSVADVAPAQRELLGRVISASEAKPRDFSVIGTAATALLREAAR